MNNRIANDLIRYAELVEDGALISPEEMNCASVMRLAAEYLAQPEQEKERCVGCEACIDTACGRDECPKGWPKAAQPEQEPVGEAYLCDRCQTPFDGAYECPSCGHNEATKEPVYTTPPQRKPLTDEEKENAFLVTTTSDFDPLQNFFDGVAFAEIYYGIKE